MAHDSNELEDLNPDGVGDGNVTSRGVYETAVTLEEEAEAFFASVAMDDAELELAAVREPALDDATRQEVDEWCLANELRSYVIAYGEDAARLVVLKVSVELEQRKALGRVA